MPSLDQLPLFRLLTPEEFMDILRMASVLKTKPGQVLCSEGDPAEAMFLLESGKVLIQKRTIQGLQEELGTRGPGTVVGELALLDGLPRSATVTATEAGTVYRLARADFLLLRNHLHPAAFKVIRNLARELCGLLREQAERLESIYANPEKSLLEMERRHQQLAAQVLAGVVPRSARPASSPGKPPPHRPTPPLSSAQADAAERQTFLGEVPLLRGLAPTDLKAFDGVLRPQTFRDGPLCVEGSPGDAMYLVAKGEVRIEQRVGGGPPQRLGRLGPGALIGEIALIDGRRRSASAIAEGSVVALRCDRAEFDALFRAGSPFAFRFVERLAAGLSRRVREGAARITDLVSRPAEVARDLRQRLVEAENALEDGQLDDDMLEAMQALGIDSRRS